jgi:hypothetical protein
MTGVQHTVAEQLKVNPDCVYIELHVDDKSRVFPFDVVFDQSFGQTFRDKVETRESPEEYNTQQDSVQVGLLHIPRAFFQLTRRFPLARFNDFIYIMHNDNYICNFADHESEVKL